MEEHAPDVMEALKEGYSVDEIKAYLAENRGIDNPDEVVNQALQAKAQEALSEGYEPEEVANHLIQERGIPQDLAYQVVGLQGSEQPANVEQPNTEQPVEEQPASVEDMLQGLDQEPEYSLPDDSQNMDNMATMTGEQYQQNQLMRAEQLSSDYRTIYEKYSTMGKSVQGLFDPEKAAEAQADVEKLNRIIVDRLREQNINAYINPETHQLMMQDDNGVVHEITSDFLRDMVNRKGEIGGAIAGGWAGAKVPGPWPVKLVGAVGGSALGAMAGRGLDVLVQANNLKEELEEGLIWNQMKDAGAFDALVGVAGQGIVRGGIGTARAVKKAYDFLLRGNPEGAYKLMKDSLFLSDEEAKAVVKKWEDLNQAELPGDDIRDKALAANLTTQPGSEGIVKAIAALHPKASTTIANQINQRAQQLIKATKDISFDKPAVEFVQALDNYATDVQTFFGKVKDWGLKQVPEDYHYDVNKVGLDKLRAIAEKNIEGLDTREKLEAMLTKIRDVTEADDFNSLLELRKLVNDFKYNKKLVSPSDYEAVNSILKGIDDEIHKVAQQMPDGEAWMQQWKKARKEYAKFQRMKKNELVRALGIKFKPDSYGNFDRVTAKKLNDRKLITALTKYVDVADDTFEEVLSRLPKKVQGKVEGQVLNELVDKYAAGSEGGMRAIHFPELAAKLRGVKFRSPKAKQLKRTIYQMSELFKNDPNLARVSGNISLPRFQSYLTTDPVVRAKFEIASNLFNYVKKMVPGEIADTLALVERAGKLLDNPLNLKSVQEYMRAVPKDERVHQEKLVRQLQQAWAAAGRGADDYKVISLDRAAEELNDGKLTADSLTPDKLQKLKEKGYTDIVTDDGTINIEEVLNNVVEE